VDCLMEFTHGRWERDGNTIGYRLAHLRRMLGHRPNPFCAVGNVQFIATAYICIQDKRRMALNILLRHSDGAR